MKRWIEILLAIAALAAGVTGAQYGRSHYLESVTLVRLPVPVAEIQPYTVLTAEMFVLQDFPKALADQGLFTTDIQFLTGKMTTSVLASGVPVPDRLVVPAEQFRLADQAFEVVSIPIKPEYAVAGQIQPGEIVNIYSLMAAKNTGSTAVSPPESQPATLSDTVQVDVILIASTRVVGLYSGNGNAQMSSSSPDGQQQEAPGILVVAAPPDKVEAILAAIAKTKVGASLWITLATP